MFLYNTLTRTKEEFRPMDGAEAKIYTCGPTVYHFAHVGNFRTYLFEDILKRVLKLNGFRVKHVMNVTDVGHLTSDADSGDDKMELGAKREGKTAREIAAYYADAFFRDFKALNCVYPDVVCNATDHIREMIELVKTLEARGYTYRTSDGIYFDTSKFPAYDRLAGKSHIDGLKSGARVEFSAEKKNPSDFSVWKFSPKGQKRQMEWDSPWGTGFPGWHIECSAMAIKYLGETMDIHCGGIDHVAVHHTNEIAQSECATGKQFARFWLHGEFLLTKDGKMAKSSGEFLTLERVCREGFDPLDYRYFCLGAHYKTQLEFSWQAMESAKKSLSTLRENIAALKEKHGDKPVRPAAEIPALKDAMEEFKAAVSDDMNMPKALAVVWENLRHSTIGHEEKLAFAAHADSVLGLKLLEAPAKQEELPPELAKLMEERIDARKNKDFAKSDLIRKQLEEKGVTLKDTPKGCVWTYKKK